MANSTSPVPQVLEGTGAVAKINELIDAMSQGLIGGKNWATSALLTWGYLGGRINGINVANGTVTLTASATNYLVMKKSDGVVSVSTATTNWNDTGNYWRLYSIVVSTTAPTSYADERFGAAGPWGIGGGLNNPMTTAGDLVVGGTGGSPNRLPVGSNTQVLTMVSGLPAWAAPGAGTADMLSPLVYAEVSVTAAATATLDKMHVCSGTTADYALTLPAAASSAGRFVGVRMAPGLTRWVTITGNGAELIDGSNTRKMWANETAILYCNGAGWVRVGGRSIPLHTIMKRSTAQAMAPGAWTIIPAPTVVNDNTSSLAVPAGDTTNGRVRVLRASRYQVAGFVSGTSFASGRTLAGGAIMDNGTNSNPTSPVAWGASLAPTSGLVYGSGSSSFLGDTAKFFYLTAYNEDAVSRNTQASSSVEPHISVLEVPDW